VNLIGYIAGLLTLVVFVPQVIKTITTKQTKDLSLLTFIIVFIGATLWIIYGLDLGKPQIWAANLVVACLSLVILGYKLRYK
jgi:MtN3 and saliva related transmembrane protein